MNTLKVGVLLAGLTALFLAIGNAMGGQTGMVIAGALALAMNFGTYWFSDKIVLKAVRGQELTPEQAPELFAMTQRLAERAQMPMPRLWLVADMSPNAFATGRSPKHGVVAVNQGLLNMLDKREVEGVIAHELAHIANRDTLTMAITASIAGAIGMIANMVQFAAMFGGLGGNSDEEGMSPIAALALAFVAPLMAMVIQMAISRAREYEADKFAARLVGTGEGLSSALMKLERGAAAVPSHMPASAAHMCIVNPLMGGLGKLLSTHPPIQERVRRLRELESSLAA
jgi:heat shock protein HtpX